MFALFSSHLEMVNISNRETNKKVLCVYHDGCRDGFASSMVWRFYNSDKIRDYIAVDRTN